MYFFLAIMTFLLITIYDWYNDNLKWDDLMWNAIAGLVWPITIFLLLLVVMKK